MNREYTLIGYAEDAEGIRLVDAAGNTHGPMPASAVVEALREISSNPEAPPVNLEGPPPALSGLASDAAVAVERYVEKKSHVAHRMLQILAKNWPHIKKAHSEGERLDYAIVGSVLKGVSR